MITPMIEDGAGGAWFGFKNGSSQGGVGHFILDPSAKQKWELYPAWLDSENRPGSGFVLSLLPDEQGGVWVGTLNDHLGHFDGSNGNWVMLESLPKTIFDIAHSGSKVWMASYGQGIVYFDRESDTWESYTEESTSGGIEDDEIINLIVDETGGIWAGTYGGGVSHFDESKNQWQSFTVSSTGGMLGNNDIRDLLFDEEGYLWTGTFGGGISRYSPSNDTWDLFTSETTKGGLVLDYVLFLLKGSEGKLWAVLNDLDHSGGLAYFDGQNWQTFTVSSTNGGLASNDVSVIADDGSGGIWVGTYDGGLSHLASDLTTWTTYTVKSTNDGLAGDNILSILSTNEGVWVGTSNGISYMSWISP